MADAPLVVDGSDNFQIGMDSYTNPNKLVNGEYVSALNVINRGGLIQTRPGSASTCVLPEGRLQGCTFFTPLSGVPQIVFAVDGLIYVSSFPFSSYSVLPSIQFSKYSRFIAWASCIKSTDYDNAGVLYYLNDPYPILIIQDGVTRAAYYDGTTSGHLNPTISTGPITLAGFDETPVGLWMSWANNRLWVSRNDRVFASDIGNPTKFTETQYLNTARAFYLPGRCTGIAKLEDMPGIVCFTATTGTLLQSSIQDRTLWLTTPGFQSLILPGVGCIAPRSIVHQYGLLWWWTAKGLISQNGALQTNISSRLDVQDNEMFQSKYNLSYDLEGVCGSRHENFLFHAVPNGDRMNNRVHVLDTDPFGSRASGITGPEQTWPSYWTGWRPVEFAYGVAHGRERCFTVSPDQDGKNRLWELFRPEKTDNGIPITCYVATRPHFFESRDYKGFRYAEIELDQIIGPVAVAVAVKGLRGAFQKIMEKDISAVPGQVYANSVYGFEANPLNGSRFQSRVIYTNDDNNASDCNSECVESSIKGLIDKAFSLAIIWSGQAGVSCYRMYGQFDPEGVQAICEENETGQKRVLSPEACGSLTGFVNIDEFDRFYATGIYSKTNLSTGLMATNAATRGSIISQIDATRRAVATAKWLTLEAIGETF